MANLFDFNWPLLYYRNLNNKLDILFHQGKRIMATVADLTAVVGTISADLTKLAADVAALQSRGGISPSDLDPVLTALQGAATSLESLDASIAAPAPPPPPPVTSTP